MAGLKMQWVLAGLVMAGAFGAATDAGTGTAPRPQDLGRFLPADGNNVYAAAKGLWRTWPAGGPKELWRQTIGFGKSGVAERAGRIFTLAQIDMKQYGLCLDAATGQEIWRKLLVPTDNHHQVKGPVSSPLVDGDRVYFFPYVNDNGDVYSPCCPCFCMRTDDGATVWSEGKLFNCSEGTTPLIVGDVLYIGGGGKENIAQAVDKATGRLLWKTAEDRATGGSNTKVYVDGASVVYQEVGPIAQIIVGVWRNDLMGVEAKTGKVLWHWTFANPVSSGMVPTPVVLGNRVLLSASQGAANYMQCLEMVSKDGGLEPKLVYESDRLQCNQYHTPSVWEGAAYGFGRGDAGDALQCVNAADGKLLWQKESTEWRRDRQLTIADGLMFAITVKEELVLLEANKTGYKELGRVNPGIKLGFPQQPMISNGRLYLRGEEVLVCYEVGEAVR
jgi:outer membrane protein assembly factor BamB